MTTVELERKILVGDFNSATSHFLWVSVYSVVVLFFAVLLFLKQMKSQ